MQGWMQMKKSKQWRFQDQLQGTLHHQQCFRKLLLLRLLPELRIHRQQNQYQIAQQNLHHFGQQSLLLRYQQIRHQVEQ